jgi:integrase
VKNLVFRHSTKHRRIPVVFTKEEAFSVIDNLDGSYKLMAQLMFGSGLRVTECLRLRVKDIDFGMNIISIIDGKGGKHRTTLLPSAITSDLTNQIEQVKHLHQADLAAGYGEVYMPDRLAIKYPSSAKSLAWQYLFPASQLSVDPRSKKRRRHHIIDRSVQRAVKKAILEAALINTQAVIPSVTALQPHCCSKVMTSEPFRNYWVIRR